jgi:2-polyprenyl-3-methyl-5-hydroxy-6-metoxy-1,4-benzoquinol methylase
MVGKTTVAGLPLARGRSQSIFQRKDFSLCRLDYVCVFLLGVILTYIAQLHSSASITGNLKSGNSSGSSLHTIASSNELQKTSTNSKDAKLTDSFQERHAMQWKIPEHIVHQRDEECSNAKVSKTGGFCLTKGRHVGGNQMQDVPMATFLAQNIFNGKSVVDLGAGLGHYGTIMQKVEGVKVDWVGYDGAINVQGATDGLVRFMDLTQPHASDERPCVAGDWVLSLEVAEHIPPEHTDAFLRNIRCHTREGAVISWALPTQMGGLGHVNMKEEKDAIEAVEKCSSFSYYFSFQKNSCCLSSCPFKVFLRICGGGGIQYITRRRLFPYHLQY